MRTITVRGDRARAMVGSRRMRSVLLILLLAWTYGGCGGRLTAPRTEACDSARGRVIEVLVSRPADERRLASGLTSADSRARQELSAWVAGPFRRGADPVEFEREPASPMPRGGISRLRIRVVPRSQVESGLRRNDVDLAVLHGPPLDPTLLEPSRGLRVDRLEAWEITWALWLNPRARWLNDPRLRRWLVDVIDRPALLELVLAGHGDLVGGLFVDESPRVAVRPPRPLSHDARPRLELLLDEDEPGAGPIAARLKAELDSQGFQIVLVPRSGESFRRTLGSSDFSIALLTQASGAGEALATLSATLSAINPQPVELSRALAEARLIQNPKLHGDLARSVARSLGLDGRLTALVRTRAWRVAGPGLRVRRPSGSDHLDLPSARLVPTGRTAYQP